MPSLLVPLSFPIFKKGKLDGGSVGEWNQAGDVGAKPAEHSQQEVQVEHAAQLQTMQRAFEDFQSTSKQQLRVQEALIHQLQAENERMASSQESSSQVQPGLWTPGSPVRPAIIYRGTVAMFALISRAVHDAAIIVSDDHVDLPHELPSSVVAIGCEQGTMRTRKRSNQVSSLG